MSSSIALLPSILMADIDFAAIAGMQPLDHELQFPGSSTPLNGHLRRLGGTHCVSLQKGIIHLYLVAQQLQWALIIPSGHPAA